ncbi:MAG: phosphoribosylformylglycinamidine synthase subunit PurL [Opitutales bacterium]
MSQTQTLPPDDGLKVTIDAALVERHGLTAEEYARIREILGRVPNLTELGVFSVMWSEHCAYKHSRPLLKGFPTQKRDPEALGQVLVKAGEENAGVIDIGDGWAIAFKIESHNHPSYVEPFEGAATGVGGIIRDIFTMGARPVLLTNSLRFGDIRHSARARRILRGVVHGIAHYGNCIGIPNVGGDVYFDPCFEHNPLVNALCLGVLRHEEIKRGAASGIGNPVFYVGPPTGRDGLGGASFASREITDASIDDRPAVQKGDPFMEKLCLEACLEMMAIDGLVVGIQDMGAAGLTCSTCETASRGGTGIRIDLDKVPQRAAGMSSYEILLSESQERMLVIAASGREAEVEAVFAKWDLPAVHIGAVTEGVDMVVEQEGRVVARMPARSLTDEAPLYHPEASEPTHIAEARRWNVDTLPRPDAQVLQEALPTLLSEPAIASKRWIWRQYDHMVMAGTVLEPGSDAAVVRIDTGDGGEKLIAIANDGNPHHCHLDPYLGALGAMAECLRNLACSGALPLGMTDNLNFGNPQRPESFYMLRESVRGLAEACEFFDVPVTGGNVSLYNESPEGGIKPNPVVSVAGLIRERAHVTCQSVREPGLNLFLLGGLPDHLGASQYLRSIHSMDTGAPPPVDLPAELRLHDLLRGLIAGSCITTAHDLSDGGLLVALSEMLLCPSGHTFGASIELTTESVATRRLDVLCFGEVHGRALVAAYPKMAAAVTQAAAEAGVPCLQIGRTTVDDALKLTLPSGEVITWASAQLRSTWGNALEAILRQS